MRFSQKIDPAQCTNWLIAIKLDIWGIGIIFDNRNRTLFTNELDYSSGISGEISPYKNHVYTISIDIH